ncbi:HD domain-containing protein [Propionispora vibrioides]|uniref:Putative hydrolases of HD superfamily n=1 Tax=Propionispora vibrioides TaxID=112903 RepID=A0A1H8Y3W4_9FIRM|nr:HD domain-containing protein [Propionispora vibrioides]SEP46693.1 putative hydrolases of HD superfamily [Propionispora vibrioides]
MKERLSKQLAFIVEIDKLKQIFRQSRLIGVERNENDAEHSWHLAVMAILLAEYAGNLDILKVIKMVLIHDLVEIEAGDTFCYDEAANQDKRDREVKAADHLFGLLPADQAKEIRALWDEFEAMHTREARFAACLDRLEPLLLNYHTQGHTWQRPGITSAKVFARCEVLKDTAPALWEYVQELIESAINQGFLVR